MRATFVALTLSAYCTALIGSAPAASAALAPVDSVGTIAVTVRSAISLTVVDAARGLVYAVSTNSSAGYSVSVDAEGDVVTITAGLR